MSELDDALRLANRVLDKPYIDPDGDICMLARQLLRQTELLARAQPQGEPVALRNALLRLNRWAMLNIAVTPPNKADLPEWRETCKEVDAALAAPPVQPDVVRDASEGSIVLTAAQFDEFMRYMTEPAEPTEAIRQGAALLRSLAAAPRPGGKDE